MKIFAQVKPGSKDTKIEKISENTFLIKVKEPPIDGKANQAVIRALAKFYNIAPTNIKIISGANNKKKIIDVQA